MRTDVFSLSPTSWSLRYLLLILACTLLYFMLLLQKVLFQQWLAALFICFALLLLPFGIWLLHRQQQQFAFWWLLVINFILLVMLMWIGAGLESSALLGMMLILAYAAIMGSHWHLYLTAVLVQLSILILYSASHFGLRTANGLLSGLELLEYMLIFLLFTLILRAYPNLSARIMAREQQSQQARKNFEHMFRDHRVSVPWVTHWLHTHHAFGGDFILMRQISPDCWQLMVVDATGQDMAAAMALMPVLFEFRQSKLGLRELFYRLNQQVHQLLPPEQFVAVALIEINSATERIEIINAGLPDIWLLDEMGQVQRSFASSMLALGIVASEGLMVKIQQAPLVSLGAFLVVTDGILAFKEHESTGFTLEHLQRQMPGFSNMGWLTELKHAFFQQVGTSRLEDDLALVLIDFAKLAQSKEQEAGYEA